MRVLGADVVIRAGDRCLDVAERGVDPIERRPAGRLLAAAGIDREVPAASPASLSPDGCAASRA